MKFGRIAAYETEFADTQRCQQAADTFLAKPWPVNTTYEDRPVFDHAGNLIISIKVTPAVGECYETRFSVKPNPYLPGSPITYFEIEKVSDQDDIGNGCALKAAVKELKENEGAKVTRDAIPDDYSINQKRAWRALLHFDDHITDDNKVDGKKFTTVRVDFGVVTNPPYPP